MKDYLKEMLSDDEKAYIYGIIEKTSYKFMKGIYKVKQNETLCLSDESINEDLLCSEDSFNIIDKILENKILRDVSALNPYTQYEKEKTVQILDNFALEAGLESFIAPLTFNEKLVVFLLYIENYQVNEVAILLGVTRMAIWKRDKSIKNKIREVKEKMKNGK